MATQSQTPAIIQNENLHILKGKGEAIEPPKKKKGLKDGRKALADLSKKAPPSQKPSKGKSSAPRGGSVHPPGTGALTDEEIRRCREWAKEGIERVHFTGNDARKLEREIQEERVRKEVEMVMSSLWSWSQMAFDSFFVTRESAGDLEDVTRLELEPEVDLPLPKSSFFSGLERSVDFGRLQAVPFLLFGRLVYIFDRDLWAGHFSSLEHPITAETAWRMVMDVMAELGCLTGNETEDPLLEDELHMFSVMDHAPIELKLKDSDDEMP